MELGHLIEDTQVPQEKRRLAGVRCELVGVVMVNGLQRKKEGDSKFPRASVVQDHDGYVWYDLD